MIRSFNIIDGIVYLDKMIYQQAQLVDNQVSKLTGSTCVNIFSAKPIITSGIQSVTIDYHNVEGIGINQDPMEFVEDIRDTYHDKIRGHIIIDVGNDAPLDIFINNY